MSDPRLPTSLADEINALRRRLDALERKAINAVGNNSLTGTVSILHADGTVLARMGEISGPASGFEVGADPSGASSDTLLRANSVEGVTHPFIPIQTHPSGEFIAVTSGTFVPVWRLRSQRVTSRYIQGAVQFNCDGGATGEARIVLIDPTAATSPVLSLSLAVDIYTFKWPLPSSVSVGGAVFAASIEVRRTNGVGQIAAFTPDMSFGSASGTSASAPWGT